MALKEVIVSAHYPNAHTMVLDNQRGAQLTGAVSPQGQGFTPLELMAASLASCVGISVRIVAKQLGISNVGIVDLTVRAIKADDAPSRLDQFEIKLVLSEALTPELISKLVSGAEEICTISNTLKSEQIHISCSYDESLARS